jgi:flagellar basal-body rod modification protein FlgD
MMTISAISSANVAATQTSNLGLQDFMKILLTQLTTQDPLKPMDNKDFMAQIAQFTTLEQTQQLNDKTATLITNQAALQSVGLIGRTVDFTTSSGSLTGVVAALSLAGNSPQLTIQTTAGTTINDVSLSQLTSIR